jgi:hypothetical protein
VAHRTTRRQHAHTRAGSQSRLARNDRSCDSARQRMQTV